MVVRTFKRRHGADFGASLSLGVNGVGWGGHSHNGVDLRAESNSTNALFGSRFTGASASASAAAAAAAAAAATGEIGSVGRRGALATEATHRVMPSRWRPVATLPPPPPAAPPAAYRSATTLYGGCNEKQGRVGPKSKTRLTFRTGLC